MISAIRIWRYGVERDWLGEMLAYWRDDFDWRAQEEAMNAYPHFKTEIDGAPIHFMHVRGKGPSPIPLILTHGWPWTFWDYRALIGPLTDPAAHGRDRTLSFDVVIPSLPGFGLSTPLRKPGIDPAAIADMWAALMAQLGYQRFAAAGGDFGAMITAQLGQFHPDRLIGVYTTLAVCPGFDRAKSTAADFAPDEQWMVARMAEMAPAILSHITVHRLDPQTLAYALVDSPAGMAAWIWERRRAWSDCGGDLLAFMSRDELCTLASLYWFNGAIGTSLRLYWERFRSGAVFGASRVRSPDSDPPVGMALFPKDVVFAPRAVVAANVNLKHWTIMPRGGHFGPAEQPDLVIDDLRAFFQADYCAERFKPG